MQNSLRDADEKYKVGTRITMRNFSVTPERGKPPLVVVDPSALSDGGLFVTDHGKIPAPPPSVHLNVLRLSEDNTLRLTRDPAWYYYAAQVAFDDLHLHHKALLTTCLQNIAQAALRLQHFGLALAYAVAAACVIEAAGPGLTGCDSFAGWSLTALASFASIRKLWKYSEKGMHVTS